MKKEKRTIHQILISACLLLFIVPLLLVWIFLIWTTSHTVKENVLQEQDKVVQLVGSILNGKISSMKQDVQRVRMDSRVQAILEDVDFQTYNSTLMESYQYLDSFYALLNGENAGNLDNLIVMDNQSNLYSASFVPESQKRMMQTEWKKKLEDAQGRLILVDSTMKNKNGETLLTFGQLVLDIEHLRFMGAVFLSYRQSALEELFTEEHSQNGGIFLLTPENVLSSQPLSPDLLEYIEQNEFRLPDSNGQEINVDGNKIILTAYSRSDVPIQVVRYFSFSNVLEQLCLEQITVILIIFVAIGLFGIYVLYLNRKIYRPLQEMVDDSVNESDCYELSQINDTILSLKHKNQDGEEEMIRLIDRCKTTTIDKLQAQINPHFLYNTLSTIKYIAILNQQDKISQLISSLVKLLRSVVSREGSQIPLKQELENVQYYMNIQNAAYEGNIDFQIHAQAELLETPVPNFILQPLVENCIFHGIHPNQPGGKIEISAQKQEEILQIEIVDNGDGFQDESLLNMLESSDNQNNFTNLGIKAVHQKIQLLCGMEYGLKIFSQKGIGTKIVIYLPAVCQEPSQEEKRYDSSSAC